MSPQMTRSSLVTLRRTSANSDRRSVAKPSSLMVDGDFQMVYYRTDVLAEAGLEPPVTWEDYLDVASKIHGTDMNGDGEADYGSCIFKSGMRNPTSRSRLLQRQLCKRRARRKASISTTIQWSL